MTVRINIESVFEQFDSQLSAAMAKAALQTDATAKQLLDKYKLPMPNQGASDDEIRAYIAYFRWADANLRPQGKEQPQPAAQGTALQPN